MSLLSLKAERTILISATIQIWILLWSRHIRIGVMLHYVIIQWCDYVENR